MQNSFLFVVNGCDSTGYKNFKQIKRNRKKWKQKIMFLNAEGTYSSLIDSREKMSLDKNSLQFKPEPVILFWGLQAIKIISHFLSCLLCLSQNKSRCTTLHWHIEICLIFKTTNMQVGLISIWMVLHQSSFWNRRKRQLGNGLLNYCLIFLYKKWYGSLEVIATQTYNIAINTKSYTRLSQIIAWLRIACEETVFSEPTLPC